VSFALNGQQWKNLTFLHWPIPPARIRPMLPEGLELDIYDGAAWIGITPFQMTYLGAPALTLPYVSTFTEVNVRTYVRAADGTNGIWFFSIECSSLPVVAALRVIGVPYFYARTRSGRRGRVIRYLSRRPRGPAAIRVETEVGNQIQTPNRLLDLLTGRWNAYTHRAGRLWRVPIEHQPWPLYEARARVQADGLLRANGLCATYGEPFAHFSPGVQVRLGGPQPVRV